MGKKYDVVATVGKYEKDGIQKYVTRNVGAVIETDKGLSMTLDASFNPAGCPISPDGKIWLKFFDPRADGQQSSQPSQGRAAQSAPFADFDDSILPF